MKQHALYKAIVLSMGIAGAAGIAHADSQPVTSNGSTLNVGEIQLTFGGFVEGAVIYRDRDQVADVGSKFQSIPFPNSDAYHLSDFRESGRQSRLSLLAQGPEMDGGKAEAYYEGDFLGVGTTSNSNQSNSYTPRVRQAFADYTSDSGFQVLAGQAWSLVTQNKSGINARGENVPLTIDAQYVAGFNWTRNPQLRFTDKFSDMVTGAFSLESPAAITGGTAPGFVDGAAVTTTTAIAGGQLLNGTTTYTTDPLPDAILKFAFDPGYGHYEVLGMDRHFRDRVDPTVGGPIAGVNSSTSAFSFGANAIVPLIPKVLDFQASFLSGKGDSRYGTSTLPDYTYKADGSITAIKGTDFLVGLTAHPTSQWDLYLYAGQEKVDDATEIGYKTATTLATTPNVGFGGLGTCAAAYTCPIDKVQEVTAGFWYKFNQGAMSHVQTGLQIGHLTDTAFADTTGVSNKVSMNEVMASFRFYPFSK